MRLGVELENRMLVAHADWSEQGDFRYCKWLLLQAVFVTTAMAPFILVDWLQTKVAHDAAVVYISVLGVLYFFGLRMQVFPLFFRTIWFCQEHWARNRVLVLGSVMLVAAVIGGAVYLLES